MDHQLATSTTVVSCVAVITHLTITSLARIHPSSSRAGRGYPHNGPRIDVDQADVSQGHSLGQVDPVEMLLDQPEHIEQGKAKQDKTKMIHPGIDSPICQDQPQ
jgi:hypothetical protein